MILSLLLILNIPFFVPAFIFPLHSYTPCRQLSAGLDELNPLEDDADADGDDGLALAKEFYAQLRQREDSNTTKEDYFNPSDPSRDPDEAYTLLERSPSKLPSQPFVDDGFGPREVVAGKYVQDTPKKFTGAGNSVFGSSSGDNTEFLSSSEMGLLNRFEQTIAVQAGFALLMLVVVVFVGLNGGIVSYSADELADMPYETGFDQAMPEPTDTEYSVWL